MSDLSVVFKVISDRNCPFYSEGNLFVLTSQAVHAPYGHPSCLILVREMTNMLFNTIMPAAATGFDELKNQMYTCGGCTGLIKFQVEDNPEGLVGDTVAAGRDRPEDTGKAENNPDGRQRNANQEGVAISGLLSEISPSELLQFFHMHQKTGKLVLDLAAGTGRVIFREGAIIEAEFLKKKNKEAVFALLREDQGSFSFVSGIPTSLQKIEDIGDFMMLLMEGIKRMDEDEG